MVISTIVIPMLLVVMRLFLIVLPFSLIFHHHILTITTARTDPASGRMGRC